MRIVQFTTSASTEVLQVQNLKFYYLGTVYKLGIFIANREPARAALPMMKKLKMVLYNEKVFN